MKVATAANTAALQTWLDTHDYIAVHSILHDGTQFVIVYSELPNPSLKMADRVNTNS